MHCKDPRTLFGILDAATDLIAISDASQRLVYVNPAGRAMVGWPLDADVTSRSIADLIVGDATATLALGEGVAIAIRAGQWTGERRISGVGGRVVDVALVILAHAEPGGQVDCFSIIARDVTERKQLERQFLQAQKMEAIGRLAGGVAHDFNNLLTAILGFGELIQRQLPDDSQAAQDIKEVIHAGRSAAELTKQLLAFSRQQRIQPQIIDIDAVVQGMEGLLRRVIGEDIELLVHPSTGLDLVNADRAQIEQIVMNLVVNARDAMPTGGRLTIETGHVELDEAYIAQHPGATTGSHVMIAVTDTGCGMDEQVRARIFEPFYTTKELGRGTGLGLSTVYGIVKQNRGSIWVYSEVGHGTAFKVYWPRIAAATADAPPADDLPPSLHGTEAILVVDDQHEVRSVARAILQRHGYTVIEATDGEEALKAVIGDATVIDLLLIDVVLPRMSGQRVVELLRRRRPGVPVLYMSGYTADSIGRHMTQDAHVAFVEKPFTAVRLLQNVRAALGSSRRLPSHPARPS
jgi:two-component system, cell cycle sensor histidine kinase and response regulator CckA